MNLRLRLIMAFVALSVVPLGAMTWYTYTSNAQALRDAAERESDMLASELSQRMQLITTQLSERVENLMDFDGEAEMSARISPPGPGPVSPSTAGAPAGAGQTSEPAPESTAPAAAAPEPAPSAAEAKAALEAQVADRLGDVAMLLNNVELRGRPQGREGSGRGSRGPGRSSTAGRGPRPSNPDGSAVFTGPLLPGMRRGPTPAPGLPRTRLDTAPGAPPRAVASNPAAPPAPTGRPDGPPLPADPATAAAVPPAPDAGQNDRIRIDLSAIRREMFSEIAPGQSWEDMEPAERTRVMAEITQRVRGIQQGLRLGAAELQKQAAEAKRDAEAAKAPAAASTAPGPAQPVRRPAPAAKKPATLSGNRLNVRREQNGVVQQASAEVNLPDLLLMVFAATPRDRGEVPFAVDKAGRIYTPTNQDRERIVSLGGGVSSPDSKLGATRLPEWIVVTTADPTGSGLRFGIARPMGEALDEIRKTAARSAGLGLLFISLTLIGIVPLSAGLTRNLSRLSAGVHRIARGDYGARVSVKTHDEIGQLAQAFNKMAGDVERHQRLAIGQERIKRELELGRQIQHDMLPHTPLRVGQTEIRGTSTAAGEVGGDFFNYFELTGGQIALLVGDVSGKGVGAALLMANIQASLRTRLALGQGLTALAEEVDRDIQANTPGPVYATLFVAILDPATRVLRYVNAGHNPQYVLRRRGGLERLESSGLPVGLLAGRGYSQGQIQLEADDLVFCYTDGCVEAESEAGDMFGAEALERDLLAAGPRSAEDLLQHMEDVLRKFRGTREPFDDATMMVVKVG